MTVLVNGEPRPLDGTTTVAALVVQLGRGTRGVAVAVNDAVVPRSTWDRHELHDGDRVEIVHAVQGG